MMWIYKTPIGVFKIIRRRNGYFDLWIDDEKLCSYKTRQMAAEDVYTQTTGCFDWDNLDRARPPADLRGWERVR